ncbi:MAG: hypothetical protein J3K34DRAFT_505711, partial [Monoraphidium minutum]
TCRGRACWGGRCGARRAPRRRPCRCRPRRCRPRPRRARACAQRPWRRRCGRSASCWSRSCAAKPAWGRAARRRRGTGPRRCPPKCSWRWMPSRRALPWTGGLASRGVRGGGWGGAWMSVLGVGADHGCYACRACATLVIAGRRAGLQVLPPSHGAQRAPPRHSTSPLPRGCSPRPQIKRMCLLACPDILQSYGLR